MDLQFPLVNLQSGKIQIPGYVDATEIISWNVWTVPDDAIGPAGIHRTLRGKEIVCMNMKGGMVHWTDDSFDSVSARLLEARGQKDRAEIHAAAHAAAKINKSPLAVS
jgi:hypothetical protein